jgi:hypothetical protein
LQRIFCLFFILPALFIVITKPLYINAETSKFDEYEVKSAFIYNFIKFIEWPDESTKKQSVPINLYVIGHNPFGEALSYMQGKQIRGRSININKTNTLKGLTNCHILFISSSEKGHLHEILKSTKGTNILTIADTEGFAEKGIMINFYTEEERVRFEINLDAARRANLTISSRLLSLSKIVRDKYGRGEN